VKRSQTVLGISRHGILGIETLEAVCRFRREKGLAVECLAVDGMVGDETPLSAVSRRWGAGIRADSADP
jgi:hypothetical protein